MREKITTGRNKLHHGLASAMVKLWEKSTIAKIAIKRGIPNTSNERMAEEIKLTGEDLVAYVADEELAGEELAGDEIAGEEFAVTSSPTRDRQRGAGEMGFSGGLGFF
uniref:Uncharacterized protein n=1 Tax=Ananas comosus var. bracteatus TaxID=296719 RepID=A0A6V7PAE7_ANACO|nr:unnamed protein product [Ananas comosus var. bracteatus]